MIPAPFEERDTDPTLYAARYRTAFMGRPMRADDPVRSMDPAELDKVIGAWSRAAPPLSEHAELAIAAGHWRGQPLDNGSPVPGCRCPGCTGIASDSPARRKPTLRRPRGLSRTNLPPLNVERARAVSIVDAARRLGIEVNSRGYARCPFHEDSSPSLHLNAAKSRAFCNPCGRSWDAIALYREMRGLSFPEAVRELTAA